MQQKVRWEEMFPDELMDAIDRYPLCVSYQEILVVFVNTETEP